MGAMGPMAALLASTGKVPHAVCAWTCQHRGAASWLAVSSRPDLPVLIAKSGVNHTWASYSTSLASLVRDPGWAPALQALDGLKTRVVIANGAQDPVPVPGRSAILARQYASVESEMRQHADHLLPLTDPVWCRSLIEQITSPHGDHLSAQREAKTEALEVTSSPSRTPGARPPSPRI